MAAIDVCLNATFASPTDRGFTTSWSVLPSVAGFAPLQPYARQQKKLDPRRATLHQLAMTTFTSSHFLERSNHSFVLPHPWTRAINHLSWLAIY
jgi:hypothetical protein